MCRLVIFYFFADYRIAFQWFWFEFVLSWVLIISDCVRAESIFQKNVQNIFSSLKSIKTSVMELSKGKLLYLANTFSITNTYLYICTSLHLNIGGFPIYTHNMCIWSLLGALIPYIEVCNLGTYSLIHYFKNIPFFCQQLHLIMAIYSFDASFKVDP